MIPNDDSCVCCGNYVPEGAMVCPICMKNGRKERMNRKNELLDFLQKKHTGRCNAIGGDELKEHFGLDKSTIQRYVREYRRNGVPICSCQQGYFYAANQDEINNSVDYLNRFVTGISNSRTSLLYAVITKQSKTKKVKKIRIIMEQEEGENEEINILVEK